MNRTIYIGEDIYNPLFTFTSESIVSASINTSVDLLQAELQIDTAEVSVLYNDENDELKSLAWATPLIVYYDDGTSHKFYTTRVKRVGLNQYDLTAVSYIGFLDNEMFYGGVYDGVLLPDAIKTIVRTDGLRTFNAIKSLKIDRPDSEGKMGGAVGVTWFDKNEITNDMRNSMYLRFKVNGFHNDVYTYDGGSTSWYCPLVGQAAAPNASTTAKERQYCVIGIWQRSSVDEPFPETTELFFRYGQQEISMGTPNVGDTIEIECNPSSGIVSINGVQHSITPKSSKVLTSLEVIGGGRLELANSTYAYNHHVDLEWLDYRVTDYRNGDVLLEFLPLLNTRNKTVYYRNGLNGGQFPIVCSDPDNVEFADDVEAPGLFPHEYRKSFVDSISYSPEARNYRVYGYIPICTKREAIHQVMMPSGLSLKKDADGNWLFSETPTTIVADIKTANVFEGGTIEYSGDVNEIILKEYLYEDTSDSESKEIFTVNEETEEPFIAEFSTKPAKITDYLYYYDDFAYHGPLFIYAWTENAALIPGNLLKIVGYPYNQQEKIYTTHTDSGDGSTVSVEDVTTVTPENSDRMMKRLENYYLKSHTCSFDIVNEFEKCGLKYSFINPFYEEDNGYLISCDEQFSSFSRAQCKFLCGFDPIPLENGYSNYVILTGSGTWEVPESVFEKDIPKIRVVLIGGGDGGFSGCAGETGQTVSANTFPQTYAKGGEAGDPGAGGKILDFTVVNPSATYTYSSGTGGSGASTTSDHLNHNAGASGTGSTFSDGVITHTSDDGESSTKGHVNFLTGERYASGFKLPGWKEVRNIPDTGMNATPSGTRYGYGAAGGFFNDNTKYSYFMYGAGIAFLMHKSDDFEWGTNYWIDGSFGNPYPSNAGFEDHFQKGGGCGGGAGIGEDGQAGSAATSSKAGDGGRGGNAVWIPPKATDYDPHYYGYGGHGGGGGGAGGASGFYESGTGGTGGAGGYGGRGGDGGDGCILIYY